MVQARQVIHPDIERLDCRACGAISKKGYIFCVECLKNQSNRGIDTYWKRRQSGVCVTCELPVDDGKARCRDCNYYISHSRIDKYMSKGMCRACGKTPPAPNGTRCLTCREKRRVYHPVLRKKRKDANICVHCAKQPPVPGKVKCEGCLARTNAYNASRYKLLRSVS